MEKSIQKISVISIIGLVLLAQQNCNKDVGGPQTIGNSNDTVCRLTATTLSIYNDSRKFTYFPDGRINSIITSSDTLNYQYINSSTIYIKHNNNKVDTLFLTNGLVQKNNIGGTIYNYTYDANGYLLKEQEVNNSPFHLNAISELVWQNGNLVKRHEYSQGTLGTMERGTFTYTYNNVINKTNFALISLGKDVSVSTGLYGKISKKFPIMVSVSPTIFSKLSYTFNNDSVLTKYTLTDNTGTAMDQANLVFKCK